MTAPKSTRLAPHYIKFLNYGTTTLFIYWLQRGGNGMFFAPHYLHYFAPHSFLTHIHILFLFSFFRISFHLLIYDSKSKQSLHHTAVQLLLQYNANVMGSQLSEKHVTLYSSYSFRALPDSTMVCGVILVTFFLITY